MSEQECGRAERNAQLLGNGLRALRAAGLMSHLTGGGWGYLVSAPDGGPNAHPKGRRESAWRLAQTMRLHGLLSAPTDAGCLLTPPTTSDLDDVARLLRSVELALHDHAQVNPALVL